MELSIVILSIVGCIALAGAAIFLIRKAAPRPEALPVTADWIEELSVDRYRPMLRLLDEKEMRMLQEQPGFTPQMAAKLRRQRCQIFRGYLGSLSSDFSRICLALKLVMMQAGEDRADLASALVRSQLAFTCGMAMVRVRLALFRWGLATVDAAALLKVFDGMRIELRTLVPAAMPMGA